MTGYVYAVHLAVRFLKGDTLKSPRGGQFVKDRCLNLHRGDTALYLIPAVGYNAVCHHALA